MAKAATTMTNVRQPWADAITLRGKDVENRSYAIPRTHELPVWTLVVASKAPPPAPELAEYQRLTAEPAPGTFELASIVGAMEIVGCDQESDSKWYNGPGPDGKNHAWKIGRVVRFPTPCRGIQGCQTAFRRICTHPDAERILAFLAEQAECE